MQLWRIVGILRFLLITWLDRGYFVGSFVLVGWLVVWFGSLFGE